MSTVNSAMSPPRRRRRLRAGLREIAIVGIAYAAYDMSRFLVAGKQQSAIAHAVGVLHLEKVLDLAWEQTVNQAVSADRLLAVPADYLYASLHYLVTPLVLVWMWRRHQATYNRARTTLVIATLLALVGFTLLPVAPPRMLPGFVDTMSLYSKFGWWSQAASAPRGVGQFTNQFAAMPSLHVGWALWCGWQIAHHARHRWVRVAGASYPALTTFVVVSTGNHYVLDALAGIAVVAVAGTIVAATSYAHRAWRLRRAVDEPAAHAPIALPEPAVIDMRDLVPLQLDADRLPAACTAC